MNKLFRLKFVIIAILCLTNSCDRNNISNQCNDFPSFCSLDINGESICYNACFTILSTNNSLYIIAGNTTDSEGELFLSPKFTMTIPDCTTGTWNNDSIRGLDFVAFSGYNEGNYVFPAFAPPSYQTLISNFNITLSSCDTVNKIIEGFFDGILVDNLTTDSIIIENGKFKAIITE